MAQTWKDDDDEPGEFDESRAGPEYWMHKREKYTKKHFSRCIKCGMKQTLLVDDTGAHGVCPNKRCGYREVIVEWKV